jgi:hypothetical protein
LTGTSDLNSQFAMLTAFFKPVDASDHRKQVERTAEVLAETLAGAVRAAPEPGPKRRVGRPKRERTVDEIMHAVVDVEQLRAQGADSEPLAKKARMAQEGRGSYTRWFDSAIEVDKKCQCGRKKSSFYR